MILKEEIRILISCCASYRTHIICGFSVVVFDIMGTGGTRKSIPKKEVLSMREEQREREKERKRASCVGVRLWVFVPLVRTR